MKKVTPKKKVSYGSTATPKQLAKNLRAPIVQRTKTPYEKSVDEFVNLMRGNKKVKRALRR